MKSSNDLLETLSLDVPPTLLGRADVVIEKGLS
jgi:hypothetical protein